MPSISLKKIFLSFIIVVSSIFIVFYLIPLLYFSFVHVKPSENWQTKALQTNTVLIFGFGFGQDENGKLTPDASNLFLYNLAMKQTNAKYLIMQEGVYVAALQDSIAGELQGKILIRMHEYNPKIDVNTFEAARFAILQMEKIGQTQAVVYAHNMQLARAVKDLRYIASTNPKWCKMQFIVPEIPQTPFPQHSKQRRTKYAFVYRPIELYFSRFRDFLYRKRIWK